VAKTRVFELARELNIDNLMLMQKIAELGIPAQGNASVLEQRDVERIKAHLSGKPKEEAKITRKIIKVTDRFPEHKVTDRFREGKVTADFSKFGIPRGDLLSALNLQRGELVDDRFLIKDGPIGGKTGEAEIFRCEDEHTGFDIILKIYCLNITPKKQVLDQLLRLNHPDIVSLKAYGRWMGRFYEAMEFCVGGSLDAFMPFSESEIKEFLSKIINGLNYCHVQGIIHRDIKPSNFLFRRPGKKDLVIADFGISSILEGDEKVKKTGTLHGTSDYVAPELSLDSIVSPKTDYYSMGITLLHLFIGKSPFHDFKKQAIDHAHTMGEIPFPSGMSKEFTKLVRGLTQFNRENRWGYKQVIHWLKGEPVLTDNGVPWCEDIYSGKEKPYPGYTQAKNPIQLAAALDKFKAGEQLFRGDIRRWVFDHFSADVAERIHEIEENYTDKPQLGLLKLRYLLDPSLPLEIAGRKIKTISELAEFLKSEDSSIQNELENALWNEFIECWVEASNTIADVSIRGELGEKIRVIRERLSNKNRRLALTALLYMLDPTTPFMLGSCESICTPEEIEDAIKKRPVLADRVKDLLYDGRFEEWLRAALPDSKEDISFVENLRNRFSHDRELGSYALRWRFCSSVPFPFGSEKVSNPKELATLIEKGESWKKLGIQVMTNGWLRTWLTATTKELRKDPSSFDKIVNDKNSSQERKLEAVLHILNPGLKWPSPSSDKKHVDVGRVSIESEKSVTINIRNAGRGFLSGSIALQGSGRGIAINRQAIEGGPVDIQIALNPRGLPAGSRQKAIIAVQTNGGNLEIPVSYKVVAPLFKMIGRSLWRGLLFGGTLCLLRLSLNYFSPIYNNTTVGWLQWEQIENLPNVVEITVVSLVLFCILGGIFYYVRKMTVLNR
jgi:serine/threonine protein kinase